MVLQTERLTLRHFTADDLDLVVDINNHPECIRFNRWDSMSVEDCRSSLDKWISQYDSFPTGSGVFCVENAEKEKIGMAFLVPCGDGTFELGFRLRRCHWEKGYATELSKGLIHHAKEQLHASAVIGLVHKDNHRSRRIFEKLNFSCHPHPEDGDGLLYSFNL